MKSYKTDEIDREVARCLPYAPNSIAIVDLCCQGFRKGTVKNSLKRLVDAGIAKRVWDGNERYGRFLYFTSEAA